MERERARAEVKQEEIVCHTRTSMHVATIIAGPRKIQFGGFRRGDGWRDLTCALTGRARRSPPLSESSILASMEHLSPLIQRLLRLNPPARAATAPPLSLAYLIMLGNQKNISSLSLGLQWRGCSWPGSPISRGIGGDHAIPAPARTKSASSNLRGKMAGSVLGSMDPGRAEPVEDVISLWWLLTAIISGVGE